MPKCLIRPRPPNWPWLKRGPVPRSASPGRALPGRSGARAHHRCAATCTLHQQNPRIRCGNPAALTGHRPSAPVDRARRPTLASSDGSGGGALVAHRLDHGRPAPARARRVRRAAGRPWSTRSSSSVAPSRRPGLPGARLHEDRLELGPATIRRNRHGHRRRQPQLGEVKATLTPGTRRSAQRVSAPSRAPTTSPSPVANTRPNTSGMSPARRSARCGEARRHHTALGRQEADGQRPPRQMRLQQRAPAVHERDEQGGSQTAEGDHVHPDGAGAREPHRPPPSARARGSAPSICPGPATTVGQPAGSRAHPVNPDGAPPSEMAGARSPSIRRWLGRRSPAVARTGRSDRAPNAVFGASRLTGLPASLPVRRSRRRSAPAMPPRSSPRAGLVGRRVRRGGA